jgi:DNA-binding LytR/AlgR family response regulator
MENVKPDFILVSIDRLKKKKFFLEEILYCRAKNTYTKIFTTNGESYLISKPIKVFERLLYPPLFFRINRSVIINTAQIAEINKGHKPFVLLKDGTMLIPDRTKVRQLEEVLVTV